MITKLSTLCLLLTVSMTLVSCKDKFEGQAKITHSFSAKKKAGSSKMKDIPSGNYLVKINAGKSSAKISFENGQFKESFKFSLPKGFTKEGLFKDFKLSQAQLGQTFSLRGKNQHNSSNGKPYSQNKSCVYDTYEYESCTPGYWDGGDYICNGGGENCYKVPDSSDDGYAIQCDPVPQHCYTTPTYYVPESCSIQTEYIYGSKHIKGYDITSQDLLEISILENSKTKVGKININDEVKTTFKSTYVGPCVR